MTNATCLCLPRSVSSTYAVAAEDLLEDTKSINIQLIVHWYNTWKQLRNLWQYLGNINWSVVDKGD